MTKKMNVERFTQQVAARRISRSNAPAAGYLSMFAALAPEGEAQGFAGNWPEDACPRWLSRLLDWLDTAPSNEPWAAVVGMLPPILAKVAEDPMADVLTRANGAVMSLAVQASMLAHGQEHQDLLHAQKARCDRVASGDCTDVPDIDIPGMVTHAALLSDDFAKVVDRFSLKAVLALERAVGLSPSVSAMSEQP